nr:hypothetical protein [uncultured Clostridium sp.]
MKKKIIGAILSTLLTVMMATPAFAEIIWTADKLPAGYTTNEWENKDFFLNAGNAIKKDTYTYYVKDLHGNFMKDAILAGGSKTDGNGVLIHANGHVCSYGTEEAETEYFNTQEYEHDTWHQDSLKSLNENGISNYWIGDSKGSSYRSQWAWLMTSPSGTKDGLKYAYCFNEYGYLYTNTITPDGYQVNELGRLMIDGKVMTRKYNDNTPWYGFVRFPIGALGYDYESSERAAQLWGTPNPYF